MDYHFLEINLICAQGLKPPAGFRRAQAYAVAWVDPAFKLRTRVDRTGGENPTWNDKFIFHVPAGFLADDSSSAVSVEIYATAGWILTDSLLGTVRLLVGNLRLLSRRDGCPVFDAVGIRRPSGRLHGVLNVGAMLLRRVPLVAAEVLGACPAVSYLSLMGEKGFKIRRRQAAAPRDDPAAGKDPALKQWNGETISSDGGVEAEEISDGRVVPCGPCFLGFPRRIHRSPSDQILQLSSTEESPGR
ncbi:uncharacterized protein LOC103708363 [Phoenix dactylifera]|uniref:Uncharacterized protein LOC103708363 n=1 Tax=Phoenix dactylifera TaxID=42345 RepID=A0A8B7MU47_PHODC|nr:uncharacterized protein LOC103708363 [Phoenix dactylifera]